MLIYRRAGRVSCMHFLDHGGFQQLRLPSSGEEFSQLFQRQIYNLSPRLLDQTFRTAHDQFNITAFSVLPSFSYLNQTRLVKHPLNRAVEENGMIEIADDPVEPEMNARDR